MFKIIITSFKALKEPHHSRKEACRAIGNPATGITLFGEARTAFLSEVKNFISDKFFLDLYTRERV